jgi:ring-1,2-phenylacetyl-CoA epoxidase subunit PaaC
VSSPAAGDWPLDARQELLVALADDELLVGHVLTSGAGWGPELEINIALSSIGQDEIGHARRLYEHVLAGRAEVEPFVYERPAASFRASALTRSYPRDWEDVLVRQYLYETAETYRLGLLSGSPDPVVAGLFAEMVPEETYHHDFWVTWWASTARAQGGRERMQAALGRHWAAATASFVPAGDAEAFCAAVGSSLRAVREARASWVSDVEAACRDAGLRAPGAAVATASSPDGLAEILTEMRAVYTSAPGSW